MRKECEVIKDLLPSYIDDICSQETETMIKAHIAQCEDCKARLQALRGPTAKAPREPEETDLVKQIAKREKRNVFLKRIRVVAITLVVIMLAMMTINEFTVDGNTALNFSFSGIHRRMQGRDIVKRIQKGDIQGILDKYLDTQELYAQHQAILAKLDEIEGTSQMEGMYLVEIDGEQCYISERVYQDEYQAYLQDGDVYEFWMTMIEQDQHTVPKEVLETIAASPKYATRIEAKFSGERDYQEYGENYLLHLYRPQPNKGAQKYYNAVFKEGYYYHKDYFDIYSTLTESWSEAVTFQWQNTETTEEAESAQLRKEIRDISEAAVNMGQENFSEHIRRQMMEVLAIFSQNDVEITKCKVRLYGVDSITCELQLKDARGEAKYAELNSEDNIYWLWFEVDGGTIQRIYGEKEKGRLMGQLVEERGLEFEVCFGNLYRRAYILTQKMY